jgi:Flp pilus assembly protein CpaB
VTPEQAETLSLAGSETKVQLVLRNPLDTQEQTTPGTSVAKLFGQADQPPAAVKSARTAARPQVLVEKKVAAPAPIVEPSIEIFAGSKRTVAQSGEGR